jgi:hypothetical protein
MGDVDFDVSMEDELGTFFLTDYMVRCHFERNVMKGMGLRHHLQLRNTYFEHYKRVLYIAQADDVALYKKAQQAAALLRLDFYYHFTGFGGYTAFLQNLCENRSPSDLTA